MNTTVRHGGIYVKAIIPKGAAELDGRIQKGMKSRRLMRRVRTTQKVHLHPFLCLHRSGDRVVAVNGKSLDGATHQQAVEALRDTGQVRDDFNHQHQLERPSSPILQLEMCSLKLGLLPQMVRLSLEKGHPPADRLLAPLSPQGARLRQGDKETRSREQEVREKPEYSFLTPGRPTTADSRLKPFFI